MQKFNPINRSGFFLTLILFFPLVSLSQTELSKIFKVPFDTVSSKFYAVHFSENKRQTIISDVTIPLQNPAGSFSILIASEGAIFCFRDEKHQFPIRLEKRGVFKFVKLPEKEKYWLEVSHQKSFKGFWGIRLFSDHPFQVWDEVFFCEMLDNQEPYH